MHCNFHEPRRPHGKPYIHTCIHTYMHTYITIRSTVTPYSTPYSGSYGYSTPSLHTSAVLYPPRFGVLFCAINYHSTVQYGVWSMDYCVCTPHNDLYPIGFGLGLFVPASLPANGTLDPSTLPSIGFPKCGFQGSSHDLSTIS